MIEDPYRCNSTNRQLHPFIKIAVTMNQKIYFDAQDLECPKICYHSQFYDLKFHLKPFERGGAVKIFSQTMTLLMN